jgi:hypothetical protein
MKILIFTSITELRGVDNQMCSVLLKKMKT